MSKKRRLHGSAFKTKVALAAIKEELTQAQMTSQFNVPLTQLRTWKQQALTSIETEFSKRQERAKADQETLIASLYEQIGRLQAELHWLKKKSGIDD